VVTIAAISSIRCLDSFGAVAAVVLFTDSP
jgi:hypothetical protein